MKLAILAFLNYREIVKNSHDAPPNYNLAKNQNSSRVNK